MGDQRLAMSKTKNEHGGDPTRDLEHRIVAALTDYVPSGEIETLIAETEQAIADAEATAEQEREKALDPIRSPDADAAREAAASAEFRRDRLRTLLPRLQARRERVAAAEYWNQWQAESDALEMIRDALAAEFREAYPKVEQQLVDLLGRMAANDAEILRLNAASPPNSEALSRVELVARGLERFTREEPSIATELRLPKFAADARLAWPQGHNW